MPESTNKGGRKPRVTDDDLLGVFRETPDPVLSTAEVSDALPIKRRGTLNRLRDLEEDGELDSKQIGGRNTVWWLSGPATGEESGEDADSIDGRSRPESDGDLADAVREYLDANDIPPKTAHGRDAVIDVFRYLRDHGTAKTGAVKSALASKHVDHYSNEKAMWESVRRYLEDIPGVDKPGRGAYEYAGDDTVRETLEGENA